VKFNIDERLGKRSQSAPMTARINRAVHLLLAEIPSLGGVLPLA
jgi:hypothetical protein